MAVQNGIDSKQALAAANSPTFNALILTSPLTGANGGTGVNNGAFTLTLAGNLITSGAFNSTFTMTGGTSVTFPTSGTLATTSQIPSTPISLANGGTNASLTASNGGIFYSTATAGAILAATATANQPLLSGASGAPGWSTATYPGSTIINQLLYSSAANTITGLATGNNGTLVTDGTGVPSISSTLPTAVQGNITSTGNLGNQLNTTRTSFQVTRSSTVTDVTGDGTDYTIAWNNEVYDQGNNFASDTFTAAVTGKHIFNMNLFLQGLLVAHTSCQIYLLASNGQLQYLYNSNPFAASVSGNLIVSGMAIFNLTAADTVQAHVVVSGSTKVVDVQGSATSGGPSIWAGYLLG